MTISNGRVYGGFSLLLDVDYDAMEKVLDPNKKKYNRKDPIGTCACGKYSSVPSHRVSKRDGR